MQISGLLVSSLEKYGGKTALTWEEGTITYQRLYRIVLKNARLLRKAGVLPGDRVILCAHNGPYFLAGYFALQFIGAVPAPVSPVLKSREIGTACRIIAAGWVLTGPRKYEEFNGKLSGLKLCLVELEEESPFSAFSIYPRKSGDPGQIRFTSGTTGEMRAVLLSQRNLLWRTESMGTHCLEGDVFLCPVAFPYRIMKILMALGTGAAVVSMKQFSVKNLATLLLHGGVSWMWGTPAIYRMVTDSLNDRNLFRKLRGVSSAGSFLPPQIQADFQDKFQTFIYQHYGLSEGMDVAETPVGSLPRPGSPGKACSGVQLRIDDPDRVRIMETGEIIFRGPNLMLGYVKAGEVEFFKDGEWFRTGDLGYLDREGYLFIVGRKKAMINVDGLKVAPSEVENVIYELPEISLVRVVGLGDSLRGEIPAAFVVLKEGFSPDEARLKRHCRERLANFKVPRQVYFRRKIPVAANGKFFGKIS